VVREHYRRTAGSLSFGKPQWGEGQSRLLIRPSSQPRLTICKVLRRYRDADNGGGIAEVSSANDLH
jgi:hypothetical protein